MENDGGPRPQVLSFPSQHPTRLLETYVKRSLSITPETPGVEPPRAKLGEWSSLVESQIRIGGHDISSTVWPPHGIAEVGPAEEDEPLDPVAQPEQKPKKISKRKKILQCFAGLFSRNASGKKQEMESEQEKLGRKKSTRKSSLKSSGIQEAKFTPVNRPFPLAGYDTDHKLNILSVEPPNTYYETVSEELANIVKEVKESPRNEGYTTVAQVFEKSTKAATEEEIIKRIVELLKEQGKDIDEKLAMNSNVSTFFQMLSYGRFQQLADCYVDVETPGPLPAGTGDPALVRFAFTLDFTAKLALLYNNALCRIVDFGVQYLHDRFTQIDMQKNDMSTESQEQDADVPDLD
ncbi:uncharacterized protein LOC125746960 [Brienomyrus brachyistius]|uniref:uncharacterized protein LOC125746960 n=1 Tax=Brienomyrus brachyistius TaxID=42636 RepID=UPI0020B3CA7C|nr:uncharacterized protein LOC125746960 [Brienomyrus brachyistius]